jgi:hypothetical protein
MFPGAGQIDHTRQPGRTGALTFVPRKDDGTWRSAPARTIPVVTS